MNLATTAQPNNMAKLPGWRATALFAFLLAILAGLMGRGVYLQGIHNDFLQEKGKARYSRVIEVSAHRGMISDRHGDAAREAADALRAGGLRVDVDARSESLGRRIRDNELQKIPYLLVVGDREAQEGAVAVRRHREGDLGTMTIDDLLARVGDETSARVDAAPTAPSL